jgi:hypothetical protein
MFYQEFQRFCIHGGFSEPHAFRMTIEAMGKVTYAPDDLGFFVAPCGQGHDHMIINLRDR